MAVPSAQADRDSELGATDAAAETGAPKDERPAERPRTNWPTIFSTKPKIGAADVDPDTKEISVTFDRDMDITGYSWTGSGSFHPRSPQNASPVWVDKRTCVLPVRLKPGSYYRVGINSSSYQNFRSKDGVPAATSAVYFVTAGATRSEANRVQVPKVVEYSPENGARDVDPTLKMIRVTFDAPMDVSSYSWTGGGPSFPTVPQSEKPRWSRDGKTCTLPVELRPGMHYELGLNSVYHKNFASKWGVPLEPVRYEFRTAGDAEGGTVEDGKPGEAPQIVKMVPENGAKDVDPGRTEIQVTFDRPMAAGFSWTGGGDHFPTIPEGKKPHWSADRKTCTLPVELKPNWQYRLGLNSARFKNFASAEGIPLDPVVYEFRTSPGNE